MVALVNGDQRVANLQNELPQCTLGKRLSMTVQELGYPTTKALERWYLMYEQSQDLPAGRVCLKPKYSDEQKRAATDHYLSHGRCLAATVKALGYPVDVTLAAWLDERLPARKARVDDKATGVRHARELKQKA